MLYVIFRFRFPDYIYIIKPVKRGGKVPLKLLIEVLNKFYKGNAIKWLRKLAADLPNYAAEIKNKFRDILKTLREKLKALADTLPGSLGKQADAAVNSIDEISKIADNKIDEAIKELQNGLNKSLDEGVDFERKGSSKSKNTRKQTDVDPPDLSLGHTEPSGTIGGQPGGKRTRIPDKADKATKDSLEAENRSADILAEKGYRVEQNPQVPDNKNPDYLIEGERFDCKAPITKKPRNAASEIEKAVKTGQADRIVLNLEKSPMTLEEMKTQLDDFPIEGLKEVVVIKDGKVIPFWP